MNEIWKTIEFVIDRYEISNFGNVRNKETGQYIFGRYKFCWI